MKMYGQREVEVGYLTLVAVGWTLRLLAHHRRIGSSITATRHIRAAAGTPRLCEYKCIVADLSDYLFVYLCIY